MSRRDLGSRARGALVGTAVGDALGAPFEGSAPVPRATLERLLVDPGPLRYTDDAAMTICVAESLIACEGFDGAHMAATFAAAYAAEPWRGYGGGPPLIFERLRAGEPWDRPARELFGGTGSYGNGAAMRVAPVALLAFPDLDEVATLARRTSAITHTHPEGVDGAVLQAVATAVLLGDDDGEPDAGALADAVRPHLETSVLRERLDRVVAGVALGDDDRARAVLGNGIAARDSVPTALYCALRHGHSFASAVLAAVGMGGDADTIGAMAGALAGARQGLGGIPEEWHAVEGFDRLVDLADRLVVR